MFPGAGIRRSSDIARSYGTGIAFSFGTFVKTATWRCMCLTQARVQTASCSGTDGFSIFLAESAVPKPCVAHSRRSDDVRGLIPPSPPSCILSFRDSSLLPRPRARPPHHLALAPSLTPDLPTRRLCPGPEELRPAKAPFSPGFPRGIRTPTPSRDLMRPRPQAGRGDGTRGSGVAGPLRCCCVTWVRR